MEQNLKLRIGTAAIAIPALILLIGWAEATLITGVLFLVTLGALREYFAMALPGARKEQVLGILFGAGLSVGRLLPETPLSDIGAGLLLVLLFSFYLALGGRLDDKLKGLAWTVLGAFYLGYLLPYWVLLLRLPNGRAWVFFVLAVVMSGDTVAYGVGKWLGRRKLAPQLSPGKTVEGAIGYVAGSVLAGSVAATLLAPDSAARIEIVALSVVLSILGQIGDLFESWLKRVFTVKESGVLLPGHGGLLDRLDSLIFPAVVTTSYLKTFHS